MTQTLDRTGLPALATFRREVGLFDCASYFVGAATSGNSFILPTKPLFASLLLFLLLPSRGE